MRECITCKTEKRIDFYYKGLNNCKTCVRERVRLYKKRHPEKVNIWKKTECEKRKLYKNNSASMEQRQKINAYMRVWKKKNMDKVLEINREWKRKNPDRRRMYDAKRRGAGGRHSKQDIVNLLVAQKGLCIYCRTDISQKYDIDHIMPIKLGGSNYPENLQLLCKLCNSKKGAMHPDEFAAKLVEAA